MTTKQTVIIQLLNKTFPVQCNSDEVTKLQESAIYLDTKMREIYANRKHGTFDEIVLASALNICHELINAKHIEQERSHDFHQQITAMQLQIANALTAQEEIEA